MLCKAMLSCKLMSNELESMNFVNDRCFNVRVIKLTAITKCIYAKKLSDTSRVVDIYDVLGI